MLSKGSNFSYICSHFTTQRKNRNPKLRDFDVATVFGVRCVSYFEVGALQYCTCTCRLNASPVPRISSHFVLRQEHDRHRQALRRVNHALVWTDEVAAQQKQNKQNTGKDEAKPSEAKRTRSKYTLLFYAYYCGQAKRLQFSRSKRDRLSSPLVPFFFLSRLAVFLSLCRSLVSHPRFDRHPNSHYGCRCRRFFFFSFDGNIKHDETNSPAPRCLSQEPAKRLNKTDQPERIQGGTTQHHTPNRSAAHRSAPHRTTRHAVGSRNPKTAIYTTPTLTHSLTASAW